MKKACLIFLAIFIVIDVILITVNVFPTKNYVKEIDNNIVHINMIDGYYIKGNYEKNTNTFKLYSDNKKSTINIIILEQLISNQSLYTNEEISKSINYQVLKNIKNYKQKESIINNDKAYFKNSKGKNIMEVLIRYEGLKILVVSYISTDDLYDDTLIGNLDENIIIK